MSELTHEGYTIRTENSTTSFNKDYTHECTLGADESLRNINNFPLLGVSNRHSDMLEKSESDTTEEFVTNKNKVNRFSRRLIRQGVYSFFASYVALMLYQVLYEYFGGTSFVMGLGKTAIIFGHILPPVIYFGIFLLVLSLAYNKVFKK